MNFISTSCQKRSNTEGNMLIWKNLLAIPNLLYSTAQYSTVMLQYH